MESKKLKEKLKRREEKKRIEKKGRKEGEKKRKEKKHKYDRKEKKEKKREKEQKRIKKELKKSKKDKRKANDSDDQEILNREEATKPNDAVAPPKLTVWSNATFDGDASKQNKFLRLLGAKKKENISSVASANDESASHSCINAKVARKVNADLEREFTASIHYSKGGRTGLGFK